MTNDALASSREFCLNKTRFSPIVSLGSLLVYISQRFCALAQTHSLARTTHTSLIMLTTLVTLFLTVFGALRAFPLHAGVLTLGNGLQVKSWAICAILVPLLDDKTSVLTGTSIGSGFSYTLPLVLSLPAPPLLLTLPSGISDDYHTHHLYYLLTHILLVIGSLACTLWYLRTAYLVDPTVDNQLSLTLNDLTFGNPYTGNTFEASTQLAGVLEHSSTVTTNEASTSPSGDSAVRPPQKPQRSKSKSKKSKVTVVPSPSPSPITPATRAEPSTSLHSVDASSDSTPFPLNNNDDGDWKTWTNKRQRRPSKRAPPPPTRPQRRAHSRSSSTLSSSYTSDSLFSTTSTASTAPTSVASSRRSSFATSLPPKPLPSSSFTWTKPRTPPSIVSHNKFSVLEVE
ncbi:hypothetical protein C8Q78DRAFT_1028759 [Trametes maxima]|nr:hypothetical protein C8Q78DRAFT_1028759 [Trametes maxima]